VHQPPDARSTRARLCALWWLASTLWTIATLLRVHRVWVPLIGWHRIIAGPWLWISLLAPPLLFALMLGAVRRAAMSNSRAHRRHHDYTT
jgi:hypothetical protein